MRMSLQALLDAAEFIDNTKIDQNASKLNTSTAASPQEVDVQQLSAQLKNEPNSLEPASSSNEETDEKHAGSKDCRTENKESQISSGTKEQTQMDGITSSKLSQQTMPYINERFSQTQQNVTAPPVASTTSESELTTALNMHPLFARARAAAENASFTDGSGRVQSQHGAFTTHGAYKLAPTKLRHNQHWMQANTHQQPNCQHASLPKKDSQDSVDMNFGLPSTAKAAEDMTAVQKHMKRNMTLTHNQLEKNRRAHLKECFETLKTSVPRLEMRRSSNLTILKAALRHIQNLKRKSGDYVRTKTKLLKEKEERTERATSLLRELQTVTSKERIDEYVADAIRKGTCIATHNPMLDDGQQSTSTASETEEEEIRQSMQLQTEFAVRPTTANSGKHNIVNPQMFGGLFREELENKAAAQTNPLRSGGQLQLTQKTVTSKAAAFLQYQLKTVPHDEPKLTQPPKTSNFPKYHSVHGSPSSADLPYRIPRSQSVQVAIPTLPAGGMVKSSTMSSASSNPKRSPIKLYGAPSGRSATPSPPSNVIHFFPRFSMGSGGSPPLHSSQKFDPREKVDQSSIDLSSYLPSSSSSFSTQTTINGFTFPNYSMASIDQLERVTSAMSRADKRPLQSAVTSTPVTACTAVTPVDTTRVGVTTQAVTAVVKPISGHVLTTPITMPKYTGYEVRVKYINTTGTFSTATSTITDQTHIPMKKRHLDVSTFASVRTTHEGISQPKPSAAAARSESELQMTSLYVGASASILGQMSSNDGVTYTSDNESGRDSPFCDHKRAKVHHNWRKNLINERSGKEWMEYRTSNDKGAKKALQLHHYSGPNTRTVGSNPLKPGSDSKPKATFSLWNNKHHAITMTTATNWRGKQQQQLIASKPKHVSSQPEIATRSTSSTTEVSYSLLQQASKPTVPSCLVVGQSTAQLSDVEQQKAPTLKAATLPVPPQTVMKMLPGHVIPSATNGLVQLPQHKALQPSAVSFQVPNNQIGYHIIQPTIPTSTPSSTSTSSAEIKTSHEAPSKAVSSAAAVLAPSVLNYVAVNHVAQNTSVTSQSNSVQQTAPIAAAQLPQAMVAATQLPQTMVAAAQSNQLQVPCMIPVFMYPGMSGVVPINNLQLPGLQHPGKLIAPTELMPMQAVQLQQTNPQGRVAVKLPANPGTPLKPPSRNQSTDSAASSSTLSAESGEMDAAKGERIPTKVRRLSENMLLSSSSETVVPTSSSIAMQRHVETPHVNMAHAQIVLPTNSGFVMAGPASANGYTTIPLNLLSYPINAYPHLGAAGCVQAVPLPNAQAARNLPQVWPINHAVVPSTLISGSSASIPTSTTSSHCFLASPISLQK